LSSFEECSMDCHCARPIACACCIPDPPRTNTSATMGIAVLSGTDWAGAATHVMLVVSRMRACMVMGAVFIRFFSDEPTNLSVLEGHAAAEQPFGYQQLRDLYRVGGSALAEVVRHHPHVQCVG